MNRKILSIATVVIIIGLLIIAVQSEAKPISKQVAGVVFNRQGEILDHITVTVEGTFFDGILNDNFLGTFTLGDEIVHYGVKAPLKKTPISKVFGLYEIPHKYQKLDTDTNAIQVLDLMTTETFDEMIFYWVLSGKYGGIDEVIVVYASNDTSDFEEKIEAILETIDSEATWY